MAAHEVILRQRELLPGEAAWDHGKTLARSGGVITDLEWQAHIGSRFVAGRSDAWGVTASRGP